MSKSQRDQSLDSLADRLSLLQRCPLCRGTYSQKTIQIIESSVRHKTVHIECPQCHAAMMALVVTSGTSMSLVGTITDLGHVDAVRLLQEGAITDDHLLSCYAVLKRSGAFENLLFAAGRLSH